jgi:hypothetical protein
MAWDPRTRADVARRTAEGLSKPEIIRELYPLLVAAPALHPAHAAAAPEPPPIGAPRPAPP